MRILHLNSLLKGGGTDDRSVRIANALRQLGHSVWLAGPEGRDFTKIATNLQLPFVPLRTGLLRLPLIMGTARFIRRERIEILHARHGRDYWPSVFAARLAGRRAKLVLSRHLAKSPGSWASRHFLLGQCDAMAAVSHFVARVLKEGHHDPASDNPERHHRPPMLGDRSKIHVVYGGFDMDRFRPGEAPMPRRLWGVEPEHYVFAVVGGYSLPRGKGQREFLQAAARIHTAVPHARFLIVGRGNMKAILELDINRLGLGGKASLTDYCVDMPAAMNAIDCLVLPQVGTEAIPGVVCEAHACGKPVIASDLDGIPEAFNVTGYGELVPTGNVEVLAEAMKRRVTEPPATVEQRERMHDLVAERFSLERAAQDLAGLYSRLLEGKRG